MHFQETDLVTPALSLLVAAAAVRPRQAKTPGHGLL